MAALEDHGVDGAGTAQHLAAREVVAAVAELGHRFAVISPILPGVEKRGERSRNADIRIVVGAAGLEQRDGNADTFRQTRRNSATRGARTNDDVVDLHAPLPRRHFSAISS